MKLELAASDDPILRRRADEVVAFDASLRTLIDGMLDVMYSHGGVGLAAPQVGVSMRAALVDPSGGEDASACRVMINPVIVRTASATCYLEKAVEGCLSLPGERYTVERPTVVEVRYRTLDGASAKEELTGFAARIAQHEIAHLDGELISDVGSIAYRSD